MFPLHLGTPSFLSQSPLLIAQDVPIILNDCDSGRIAFERPRVGWLQCGSHRERVTINKSFTLSLPLWIKSNCLFWDWDLGRSTNFAFSWSKDCNWWSLCWTGFLSASALFHDVLSRGTSFDCHLQSLREDSQKVLLVLCQENSSA